MKHLSTLTTALMLAGGMAFAGIASADFNENMMRIDPDQTSGDGVSTVRNDCGDGLDGFDAAYATIHNAQSNGTSKVRISIKNAKPNTLFDAWLRLEGDDQDGGSFGRSPITGGGATPLAASTDLGSLIADWVGSGSASAENGFTTNNNGDGMIVLDVDFPVENGAYPFDNMTADDLLLAQTKNTGARATPTAIVDPRHPGLSAPFLIRVVSHCQDGLTHGLSPARREAWFQYP